MPLQIIWGMINRTRLRSTWGKIDCVPQGIDVITVLDRDQKKSGLHLGHCAVLARADVVSYALLPLQSISGQQRSGIYLTMFPPFSPLNLALTVVEDKVLYGYVIWSFIFISWEKVDSGISKATLFTSTAARLVVWMTPWSFSPKRGIHVMI